MKDDNLYLIHILESIDRIQSYTKRGWKEFIASPMAQDAVARNFEIIGEATKRLSAKFKEQYPQIPWKRMAGFRDVLIHDYAGIDLEEVWKIIQDHVPGLRRNIETIGRKSRVKTH